MARSTPDFRRAPWSLLPFFKFPKNGVAVNPEPKAKVTFAFSSLDTVQTSYYGYRVWRIYSDSKVSRLEERLEKLESDLRAATLDFDELYQKTRKLLGRTVKERASMEALQTSKPEEPAPLPDGSGNVRGFLTPHQKEMQQQILRRRAGG
jgi:hypothetical protein